jgi:selenoprotein W-related protein
LTAKLLERFKQKIEGLELQPSSGGCFEVTVDGELVYSKLKPGEFPDEDQLVNQIAKRR